jgi:hypothetical protein
MCLENNLSVVCKIITVGLSIKYEYDLKLQSIKVVSTVFGVFYYTFTCSKSWRSGWSRTVSGGGWVYTAWISHSSTTSQFYFIASDFQYG